jgi:hypothetical protein
MRLFAAVICPLLPVSGPVRSDFVLLPSSAELLSAAYRGAAAALVRDLPRTLLTHNGTGASIQATQPSRLKL